MANEGFKRKLAAILSADVEGYSRLMDDDEEATVRTLTSYRNAITDLTQQFRGRVVDSPGDNILAHFSAGRYSEASLWARKSVHRKPSWRGGHAILAASLAQLNLLEEAKEAVDNYLGHFPHETISDLRKAMVIAGKPDYVKRFEEGLRKAGLPE